eukprot:1139224-Pelagomonas_calceolata.AAC.1
MPWVSDLLFPAWGYALVLTRGDTRWWWALGAHQSGVSGAGQEQFCIPSALSAFLSDSYHVQLNFSTHQSGADGDRNRIPSAPSAFLCFCDHFLVTIQST